MEALAIGEVCWSPQGDRMTRLFRSARLAALALALAVIASSAPAQTTLAGKPPAIGQAAPDFTMSGATRYGLLRDPVRLSDYKGQTVVLAFFFQARTKG
jgi:hypothetical protein